jgi:hypothetical protein
MNEAGAEGTGVSGQPADRAFDNTAVAAMGVRNGEEKADGLIRIPSPGQLGNFTLQCWYKADGPVAASYARVFDSRKINVFFTKEGLQIRVGEGVATVAGQAFEAEGEWVFLAITFSGDQAADNLRVYTGSAGQPVEAAGTGTIAESTASFEEIYAGNIQGGNRPLKGWLDNVRLWDRALSESDLESYRLADLKNTEAPQP